MDLRRGAFIVLGSLSVGLGIIGILLPLFPQTPFFLLAAYCYLRGSERLYAKLLGSRLAGKNLRDFMEHRAISRSSKWTMLATVWGSSALSFLLVHIPGIRIVIVMACLAMTLMIGLTRTMGADASGQEDSSLAARESPPADALPPRER